MPDWVWTARDYVFPLEQPWTAAERLDLERAAAARRVESERRIASLPSDPGVIGPHLVACNVLIDHEDARRQGVDTRLTTIVSLVSIAGTIVFGSLLAQGGHTAVTIGWLLALGSLYLTLQVCSAILAAVRGLGRRNYVELDPDDVLPSDGEATADHMRRQMAACITVLANNQEENNRKVTQMAVAHRALKNFVFGFLFLALLASYYSVAATGRDDLVQRVRSSHELQDLLRGPQGIPGPPGPTGASASQPPKPVGQRGGRTSGKRTIHAPKPKPQRSVP
jgi:hypothetical protein